MRALHLILDPHAAAATAQNRALKGDLLDQLGLPFAHQGLRRIIGRTKV
jgi:hypothetical protein